jgi:hypothetical protein
LSSNRPANGDSELDWAELPPSARTGKQLPQPPRQVRVEDLDREVGLGVGVTLVPHESSESVTGPDRAQEQLDLGVGVIAGQGGVHDLYLQLRLRMPYRRASRARTTVLGRGGPGVSPMAASCAASEPGWEGKTRTASCTNRVRRAISSETGAGASAGRISASKSLMFHERTAPMTRQMRWTSTSSSGAPVVAWTESEAYEPVNTSIRVSQLLRGNEGFSRGSPPPRPAHLVGATRRPTAGRRGRSQPRPPLIIGV